MLMTGYADPDRGADGPAAAARQSRIVTTGGASRGSGHTPTEKTEVRRYTVECRLDLLRARGMDRDLWQAGMTFRRHWRWVSEKSRLVGGYVSDKVNVGRVVSVVAIEAHMEARLEIDRAYAVLTPAQRLIIVAVCGEDEPVGHRADTLYRGLEALARLWVRPIGELRE